jgi:hypothetical protein
MHTQLASKVTSFTVAVAMNVLLLAGVGYLFDGQAHGQAHVIASVSAASVATSQTISGEAA